MIKLRIFSEEEFEVYKVESIAEYAQDLIRSGNETEENALQSSKDEFEALLPEGLATKDHCIYKIVNENDEDLGMIWYGKTSMYDNMAFIFDFVIEEKFRGQGYGTAALLAIEKEVKRNGYSKIGLNVFKFNTRAYALYEKCGYKSCNVFEGNIHMEKVLPH